MFLANAASFSNGAAVARASLTRPARSSHSAWSHRHRPAQSSSFFAAEWSRADEVRRGDYVAYPIPTEVVEQPALSLWYERKFKDTRSKPLPDSVSLNDDFLRLAGYYIAEGHAHRRELTWTFSSDEGHLVNDTVGFEGGGVVELLTLTARVAVALMPAESVTAAVSVWSPLGTVFVSHEYVGPVPGTVVVVVLPTVRLYV